MNNEEQEHFSDIQLQEDPEKKDNNTKDKTRFFSRLAVEVMGSLRLHKKEGLWDRNEKNQRDWGNVSEHCLVEVARTKILSRDLGLSEDETKKLTIAAGLHDFFKKGEKSFMGQSGLTWESTELSEEESRRIMRENGFSEEIIELAHSVGHGSLSKVEEILNRQDLTEHEIAFLIMHYVDDYTIDSEWCKPAYDEKNDLDRRIEKNETNPRYQVLNQDGVGRFMENETTFQAQHRIGKLVESRIAQLIADRLHEEIRPTALPTRIDEEIKKEIDKTEQG
ncbi:MAG: hypothetical protein Q7S37_05100 [bacterium]|nr:hypothetical protein [bacterium]